MHMNFKMRMEQISCCLAIKSELGMEDFTGIKVFGSTCTCIFIGKCP